MKVRRKWPILTSCSRLLPANAIVTDDYSQVLGLLLVRRSDLRAAPSHVRAYQGTLGSGFRPRLCAKVAIPIRPCRDHGRRRFRFVCRTVPTPCSSSRRGDAVVHNNPYGNVPPRPARTFLTPRRGVPTSSIRIS